MLIQASTSKTDPMRDKSGAACALSPDMAQCVMDQITNGRDAANLASTCHDWLAAFRSSRHPDRLLEAALRRGSDAKKPSSSLPELAKAHPYTCGHARSLNCEGLKLSSQGVQAISRHCPRLETLNLTKTGLKALDDSLCTLSELRTLNLSHNRISHVSPALPQLSKLQTLNLRYNDLTAWPDAFTKMPNLRTLDVETNSLPHPIPTGLTEAVNLTLYSCNDPWRLDEM